MNPDVEGGPESHLLADLAVAVENSSQDRHRGVGIVEQLALHEVADQLAEVEGSMATLRVLPVDDKQLIGLARRRRISPLFIGKQNTILVFSFLIKQENRRITPVGTLGKHNKKRGGRGLEGLRDSTYFPDQRSAWISPKFSSASAGDLSNSLAMAS